MLRVLDLTLFVIKRGVGWESNKEVKGGTSRTGSESN